MTVSAISGDMQQWNPVTIDFIGPTASETAATFRDYRLNVTFTNTDTGSTMVVPGFFAADGDAANTSAASGNVWRVIFTPPETGNWTYDASFRTGEDVAVSTDANAGTPVAEIDGDTGSFGIVESDKAADDLRKKGALEYDGDHYLTFAGTGQNLIKSGVGGPENSLEYVGFDNTPKDRHDFDAHISDWNAGDPTWGDGKGKGLIGAINYLADAGVNSLYMMVNSVGGDARSVWPWAATNLDQVPRGPGGGGTGGTHNISGFEDAFSSFDVSKLAQWGIVFEHMQAQGMVVHMILQERENDQLLNNGDLGVDRMLYLRELIARFGHNNGLIYNFGEENTNSYENLQKMSDYIREVDPYDRPIAYHILEGQQNKKYGELTPTGIFDIYSNHNWEQNARASIDKWYAESDAAMRPMPSYWDEQWNGGIGLREDSDPAQQAGMRAALWGTMTVGGAGVEWFPGGSQDLTWDDFSTRADAYKWTLAARVLFEALPVDEMRNGDSVTTSTSDFVFQKEGEIYVIYLENGGTTSIDLSSFSGDFDVRWYNPRSGGEVQSGSVSEISGGGVRALGTAPTDLADIAGDDWTILVRQAGQFRIPGLDADAAGNTAPVISGPAAVEVAEDTTAVATYTIVDPDVGDTLTYQLSGPDEALFEIDGAGNLSFVAPPDFEAPGDAGADNVYDVIVGASDGTDTDSQAVAVTVTGGPDPDPDPDPAISVVLVDAETDTVIGPLESAAAFPEEQLAGRQLSIVADIPDGSPLEGAVGSVVMNFQSGQILRTENVAPYALFGDSAGDIFPGTELAVGDFNIGLQLFSQTFGRGTLIDTVSIDFTVTPAPVNEPPVPGPDTAVVDEDGSVTGIDVLTNDSDPEGDLPLTVLGASAPNGTVTVAADNTLSYAPSADYSGVDTVTYTVADAKGAEASGTLTVTVTAVNDAPVAANDTAITEANMPVSIDVLANDSDVDDAVLTITDVGAAGNGTASLVDGTISYSPAQDFVGDDQFTYQVSDGEVSREATVSVSVIAGNEAPVFVSPAGFTVLENTVAVGTVAATDAEGASIAYSIAGGADASAFAIDTASGALSFVAPPDFETPTDGDGNGIYTVVVGASDGLEQTTQAVSVSVTDDPDEPDLPLEIFLVDSDADMIVAPLSDGVVVDLAGSSATEFAIYATVPSSSPLFGEVGSVRLDFQNGQIIRMENIDPYSLFGDSPGDFDGGFDVVDQAYSIDFDVFSGARGTGSVLEQIEIDFTVINSGNAPPTPNQDPVISGPPSAIVTENTTAVATVLATDPEADPLSYAISGGADAAWFTIDDTTGALAFLIAPDYEAPTDADGNNVYEVSVTVSDGNGGSDSATLQVTVADDPTEVPNSPPTLDGPSAVTVGENSSFVADYGSTDLDGDTVVFGIDGTDADKFDIDAQTGVLSFAQAPNFEVPGDANGDNTYDLFVFASDGQDSTSTSLAVTVADIPNDAASQIEVTLVDSDTDQVIGVLTDGASFDAASLSGVSASVVADIPTGSPLEGQVRSVRLDFQNGQVVQTENFAPYALFGDSNGDIFGGVTLNAGSYSVDLDMFSGQRAGGQLLESLSIDFMLI